MEEALGEQQVTGLPERPFVVTGCARSGTGYTAALLTRLGLPCTHEAVFNPYTVTPPEIPDNQGEASWLAVPFLRELPEGTTVLHQVREPIAVISSLVSIHFFDLEGPQASRDARALVQVLRSRGLRGSLKRLVSPARWRRGRRLRRDFVDFLHRSCPEVFDEESEWRRAERYWVEWNRAAARAEQMPHLRYFRYRLEDLDASLLSEIVRTLGVAVSEDKVLTALRSLPQTTNTRGSHRGGEPSRGVDSLLTSAAQDLARQYGYTP